jgi:Protein of unknown function (DUF3592)
MSSSVCSAVGQHSSAVALARHRPGASVVRLPESVHILLLLAAVVVGTTMAGGGVQQLYFTLEQQAWPTVTGQVTDQHMWSGISDWPGIEYECVLGHDHFLAHGIDRTADDLSHEIRGTTTTDPREAVALVHRYPVGTLVTVHYNPRYPAQALLNPLDWNWLSVRVASVGAFVLLIALRLLITYRQRYPTGRGPLRVP